MRSGSSSRPGVNGKLTFSSLLLGLSCAVLVCVGGVCERFCLPWAPSRSRLGRSVLVAILIWADVAPVCAVAAAAAAAPVAPLATGGAGPAEAMLPAGAAMGLKSHGECTAGMPSFTPLFFFVVVFALTVFRERWFGSR